MTPITLNHDQSVPGGVSFQNLPEGYYYLHRNGAMIYKTRIVVETMPGGPKEYFDSPNVCFWFLFSKGWIHLSNGEAAPLEDISAIRFESAPSSLSATVSLVWNDNGIKAREAREAERLLREAEARLRQRVENEVIDDLPL